MSWKEKLARVTLPDGSEVIGASFRGVPFFVSSAERSGGRRAVVDEFPFRDTEGVEDLGRRANSFRIEGYVLGDDYLADKANLIAALQDTAGAGELVHPHYGRRRVICTDMSVREAVRDGGVARLNLNFQDAPELTAPVAIPDLVGDVDSSADAAQTESNSEFVAGYSVAGQPSFALDSLSVDFIAVAETMRTALAGVVKDTQQLAALNADIDALVLLAPSIIRDPVNVASQLLDVIDKLLTTAVAVPRDMATALMEAYAEPSTVLAQGTTATRTLERANQAALGALLRQVLVIEAARLLPLATFETLEEATEDRDLIADALDAQALVANDAAYTGLVDLRSSLLRAVPGDSVLARIQTVTRTVDTPAILLSYQLYGDVTHEDDLLARNAIQHPGFMSGALQALTDV